MAEKGLDAATINDITEAADVGFGSFYNHFSSKEEILAAAIDEVLERIGSQIDGTVATIPDPLEALAAAIRLFISGVIANPQWAKFLVRVSAVPDLNKAGCLPGSSGISVRPSKPAGCAPSTGYGRLRRGRRDAVPGHRAA